MPLFLYTQLPCCTLRSCHLYVSGLFTYFFSQLLNCGMWRSDSDLSPLFSRDLFSFCASKLPNHSCAISPPSPIVAVVTVAPSGAKTCFWVNSCPLAAVLFVQKRPVSSPTSPTGLSAMVTEAGAGDGSGPLKPRQLPIRHVLTH